MQYVQDDRGRIEKQITPAGLVYTWLYDKAGKHTGRLTPFGTIVPPEDEAPRPPSPLRHRGPTTHLGWILGRGHTGNSAPLPKLPNAVRAELAAAPEPRPSAVVDPAGRIVRTTYADGRYEQYQRDPEGNLVARGDTKGNWWQKHIISWNLLGAEKSPLGSITQYAYTHRQKRTLVVDPNGNRTEYVRDRAQRVVEIVQNGKPYLRYRRGVQGAILEERDGQDQLLVRHETNQHGLHVKSALSSGESYTYGYDALGNFVEASSSRHKIFPLAHDAGTGASGHHLSDARSSLTSRSAMRWFSFTFGCQSQPVPLVASCCPKFSTLTFESPAALNSATTAPMYEVAFERPVP